MLISEAKVFLGVLYLFPMKILSQNTFQNYCLDNFCIIWGFEVKLQGKTKKNFQIIRNEFWKYL